ncbi:MAG: sialidase family protein [Solirubrobacteraceae bacterium]
MTVGVVQPGSALGMTAPGAAGCAPARSAIAYHAGGRLIRPAPRRLVPCSTETGYFTGETGIGVTKRGTVWFNAANWEWQLARSKDSGAHWQAFTVPGPQAQPGCNFATSAITCGTSEASKNNTVADAYLYVDPYTSKIFWSKTYGEATCSSLSMSADDGASWEAVPQFSCPGGDYEKIAAGPPAAGGPKPSGYPDVVYGCANGPAPTFVVGPGRVCWKSLDGGETWSVAGMPVPSPLAPGCLHFQEPQRVGPDGTVYMPLNCSSTGSNPAGLIRVALSHDEGQIWSYVQVPTGDVGSGAGLLGGVSLAIDRAGALYVVWPGSDHKVYLAVSRDQGQTWKGPLLVSAPRVKQAAAPFAQVSALDAGHIAIAYYGYRGKDSSRLNGYLTESFDAARRHPTFYTAQLNPSSKPLYFPVKSGSLPRNDYLGVTVGPDGTAWTALVKLLSATPDSQGFIQSTGFAGRLVPARALIRHHVRGRRGRPTRRGAS